MKIKKCDVCDEECRKIKKNVMIDMTIERVKIKTNANPRYA